MGLQRYCFWKEDGNPAPEYESKNGPWVKADEAEAMIKELKAENSKLRKALEEYAAMFNWNKVMVYRADDNSHLITEYVSIIGGPVIAQKALK